MGTVRRSMKWILVLVLLAGCAHSQKAAKGKAAVEQAPSTQGEISAREGSAPPAVPWEPPRPDAFEQCRIEGEQPEQPCRDQWGHFFLRVLNPHRLSVPANLSFYPAVNRVVTNEDGFSGLLRPGKYELTVQAPGYQPVSMTFEVGADEKAMLEVQLNELPTSAVEEDGQ